MQMFLELTMVTTMLHTKCCCTIPKGYLLTIEMDYHLGERYCSQLCQHPSCWEGHRLEERGSFRPVEKSIHKETLYEGNYSSTLLVIIKVLLHYYFYIGLFSIHVLQSILNDFPIL